MDVDPVTSGEGDTIAVRRKRRERKKTGASSALEQIKRSREMGVVEEVGLEEAQDLFQYVDEDEYARIVQQRQEEGFVLDDDGTYCEHGREIFTMEINMQDTPRCHSFVYNQRCSQRMPYSLISSSLIAAETVPLSSPGPLQHIQLHLSWPSHVGNSVVIALTHPGQNTTNCTLPGRDPPCFIASNTSSVTIGPLNASTQYKAHLHSFNPLCLLQS